MYMAPPLPGAAALLRRGRLGASHVIYSGGQLTRTSGRPRNLFAERGARLLYRPDARLGWVGAEPDVLRLAPLLELRALPLFFFLRPCPLRSDAGPAVGGRSVPERWP